MRMLTNVMTMAKAPVTTRTVIIHPLMVINGSRMAGISNGYSINIS